MKEMKNYVIQNCNRYTSYFQIKKYYFKQQFPVLISHQILPDLYLPTSTTHCRTPRTYVKIEIYI